MRDTYTYMNLEGSRDILARRNTPEIHLLAQISDQSPDGRGRSAESSPPCVFTHRAPWLGGKLDPGLRTGHWAAAAPQSRAATLGASLLSLLVAVEEESGEEISRSSLRSVLEIPKRPRKNRCQTCELKLAKDRKNREYPAGCAHLRAQAPLQQLLQQLLQGSQAPQLRPYLRRASSTPCSAHFILGGGGGGGIKK